MQQASDAMREALKGDSAASAAVSDMDVDAALEMVCSVWLSCIAQTLFPTLRVAICPTWYKVVLKR